MTKIDWNKVWSEFEQWYRGSSGKRPWPTGKDPSWSQQKSKVRSLVEAQLHD